MPKDKQIHIISGPNGSGKSSLARVTLLPNFLSSNEFVNADEIAKILSPEDPKESALEAGRLMLNKIEFLLGEGRDFALETTLSARTYLSFIRKAQAQGYKINLFFLSLDSKDLAQERVLTRVRKGGHNIEPDVICRRFDRGLNNLKEYLKIVDTAVIYEASSLELIEVAKKSENQLVILNQNLWEKIYA
jgi:predicted ABC-type ATPase